MALQSNDILVAVGVVAVILVVMVLNRKMASRPQADEGPSVDPQLCQFVTYRGAVVGETVAFADDMVILKQAGQFKAVPKVQMKDTDEGLTLTGDIDWEDALAKGSGWHKSHTAGHDPAVTEQLTTSADVRAPALAAVKDADAAEEEAASTEEE